MYIHLYIYTHRFMDICNDAKDDEKMKMQMEMKMMSMSWTMMKRNKKMRKNTMINGYYEERWGLWWGQWCLQNNAPGQGNVQKIAQEKSGSHEKEWVDTADQNFEHFRGSLLLDTKKLFINLKNQSPAVACPQKEIVLYKARRTQLTLPFVSRKGATSVGVNINPTLSGKNPSARPGHQWLCLYIAFSIFLLCRMPATWSEGRIAFWVTWSWQLHVHIELMDVLTGNSSCRNPSSMPETFKSTKLPQVSNQSQRPHLRTEYCLPYLCPARLKVLRFWGQLAGQENSAAPCCHTICAHTHKSPKWFNPLLAQYTSCLWLLL